jgi:hypothetical protein
MLNVTAYTGIGPGVHEVNVTACEVKTAKAGGDYLRWEFSDAKGNTTSANSSMEMTPGNKTGKWFAALTGKATEVGQSRALTEVIGKPATIVVELNPEGFPKVIALTARASTARAHKPVAESIQTPTTTPQGDGGTEDDQLPF